jgi:predicted N-acetyltransferase YhbS
MSHSRIIRSAAQFDDDAIWRVLEPVFRAGETYPLPRDISRADAFAYWRASGSEVFVAEDGGRIVGTYYLRANNRGGGSHVANCGYIVAANASRRGVARAMCVHSLERARGRGLPDPAPAMTSSGVPGAAWFSRTPCSTARRCSGLSFSR